MITPTLTALTLPHRPPTARPCPEHLLLQRQLPQRMQPEPQRPAHPVAVAS